MTDKELLELAAKAAGIKGESDRNGIWLADESYAAARGIYWNPLTDDGDALRLAVTLYIELTYQAPDYRPHWTTVCRTRGDNFYASETGNDPYAATRRAIVLAAAEIGKGMK